MAETAEAKRGLEGVVAGETSLSLVNGSEGKLYYRGYNIHDLVKGTFEEVVYLLLYGSLPSKSELKELQAKLDAEMAIPNEIVELIRSIPKDVVPMSSLRTVVSALAHYDSEAEDSSQEANFRKAIRLIAQTTTVVAAIDRIRNGKELMQPKAGRSLAWNFCYMQSGEEPSVAKERLMDVALTLHADHGFNASTFACRVIAGTLSDIYSAVTGAIGALKGPLHGGANEQVMRMLLKVGDTDKAEEWVRNALANKEKVMGFGHRVYKTEDPRATHLREMSRNLSEESGEGMWFRMSERIEQIMLAEKGINANVDFYSASSYYMMGIPIDLYTPIFAVSRMSGWVAHFLEQQADNRLIRPDANYLGDLDLPYTPIDER